MEGKVEEWQEARSISKLQFSLSIRKVGFSPREKKEELTWQWLYQYSIALPTAPLATQRVCLETGSVLI
jgi:hypothetical protein